MKTYRTAEVAKMIGVHPNTVRLYEAWQLIPPVQREDNHYRVFTERHIAQLRLARLAFQVEVLQNGLRKTIVRMVKTAAAGDFDQALALTEAYLAQLRQEKQNATEAMAIVRQLLSGAAPTGVLAMKRSAVSAYLGISMDTLRNWEMNGLLTVKRKANGYRVYTDDDIRRLKIIRALRCANYSLEAILRMLLALAADPAANIEKALNTPRPGEAIISACDRLLDSLGAAEENALTIQKMLQDNKKQYG